MCLRGANIGRHARPLPAPLTSALGAVVAPALCGRASAAPHAHAAVMYGASRPAASRPSMARAALVALCVHMALAGGSLQVSTPTPPTPPGMKSYTVMQRFVFNMQVSHFRLKEASITSRIYVTGVTATQGGVADPLDIYVFAYTAPTTIEVRDPVDTSEHFPAVIGAKSARGYRLTFVSDGAGGDCVLFPAGPRGVLTGTTSSRSGVVPVAVVGADVSHDWRAVVTAKTIQGTPKVLLVDRLGAVKVATVDTQCAIREESHVSVASQAPGCAVVGAALLSADLLLTVCNTASMTQLITHSIVTGGAAPYPGNSDLPKDAVGMHLIRWSTQQILVVLFPTSVALFDFESPTAASEPDWVGHPYMDGPVDVAWDDDEPGIIYICGDAGITRMDVRDPSNAHFEALVAEVAGCTQVQIARATGLLHATTQTSYLIVSFKNPSPPTPAPPTPVPDTSAPPTNASGTFPPPTPSPPSPSPPTPSPTLSPPTPVPQTRSPDTSAPPTNVPDTFQPPTPVPGTNSPPTPVPGTNSPPTPVPGTNSPPTPVPDTLVPSTVAPPTAEPGTPVPPTRSPVRVMPITYIPATSTPTGAPATGAPTGPTGSKYVRIERGGTCDALNRTAAEEVTIGECVVDFRTVPAGGEGARRRNVVVVGPCYRHAEGGLRVNVYAGDNCTGEVVAREELRTDTCAPTAGGAVAYRCGAEPTECRHLAQWGCGMRDGCMWNGDECIDTEGGGTSIPVDRPSPRPCWVLDMQRCGLNASCWWVESDGFLPSRCEEWHNTARSCAALDEIRCAASPGCRWSATPFAPAECVRGSVISPYNKIARTISASDTCDDAGETAVLPLDACVNVTIGDALSTVVRSPCRYPGAVGDVMMEMYPVRGCVGSNYTLHRVTTDVCLASPLGDYYEVFQCVDEANATCAALSRWGCAADRGCEYDAAEGLCRGAATALPSPPEPTPPERVPPAFNRQNGRSADGAGSLDMEYSGAGVSPPVADNSFVGTWQIAVLAGAAALALGGALVAQRMSARAGPKFPSLASAGTSTHGVSQADVDTALDTERQKADRTSTSSFVELRPFEGDVRRHLSVDTRFETRLVM